MVSPAVAPAALLLGRISFAKNEWKRCADFVHLKNYPAGSRSDFIARCEAGEYDGVTAIVRSNEWTKLTGPFDRHMVSRLPSSVRFICSNGAGYDAVDIEACAERGIAVSNTPGKVNEATADTTILLMLSAMRRITEPLMAVRKGQWKGDTEIGRDPENKILGIVGIGGIGKAVARRAQAFGMRVQYSNRRQAPISVDGVESAKHVSLDELLRTSDVVSLHLPLDDASIHLISKSQFETMKEGVIIVNTARGKVIDEAALVEALRSGKVFAAGLDVFESEPAIHPALLESHKTVLLPHIATATKETREAMELLVLENLREGIVNNRLVTQVNSGEA